MWVRCMALSVSILGSSFGRQSKLRAQKTFTPFEFPTPKQARQKPALIEMGEPRHVLSRTDPQPQLANPFPPPPTQAAVVSQATEAADFAAMLTDATFVAGRKLVNDGQYDEAVDTFTKLLETTCVLLSSHCATRALAHTRTTHTRHAHARTTHRDTTRARM